APIRPRCAGSARRGPSRSITIRARPRWAVLFGGIRMKPALRLLAAALCAVLGAGGASFAQSSACDRACLEGFVDRYLDALVKHDPSVVALAPNARFTENGQLLAIGDALWRSMKSKGNYRLFVTDVDAGQVAFIGTVNEEN